MTAQHIFHGSGLLQAQRAEFAAWWSLRCIGSVPALGSSCATCGAERTPSAEHLSHDCPVATEMAEKMGLAGGGRCFFAPPKIPDTFSIQLEVAQKIFALFIE